MFAFPCRDYIQASCYGPTLNFAMATIDWWQDHTGDPKAQVHFEVENRGHVQLTRNHIAQIAVQAQADYVCWMDDDAIPFSPWVNDLAKHDKDAIVPAFFQREPPYQCPNRVFADSVPGGVYVNPFPRRLHQIDATGFHAVLMKGKVIQGVWEATKGNPFGHVKEDLYFWEQAKALGFELWCDSSHEVGHLGTRVVDGQYFLAAKHAAEGYEKKPRIVRA